MSGALNGQPGLILGKIIVQHSNSYLFHKRNLVIISIWGVVIGVLLFTAGVLLGYEWGISSQPPAIAQAPPPLVPLDTMQAHIEAGRLVPVLQDWWPTFPGYHLYYANRRQIAPALALVIEALRWR